jgi:hypothetical protein
MVEDITDLVAVLVQYIIELVADVVKDITDVVKWWWKILQRW